jgi:hypothetical protein
MRLLWKKRWNIKNGLTFFIGYAHVVIDLKDETYKTCEASVHFYIKRLI